jgi:transposase-like protein
MVRTIEEYARQVREKWKAAGCPPCEHSHVERDTYPGADTGDRACRDCGAEWYLANKPAPHPGGCPE